MEKQNGNFTLIPTPLINCGERKIQKLGRISINNVLESNGLKEGDVVEVYLKKKGD